MPDLAPSRERPPAGSPPRSLRHHLARLALIVVALGVLPFVWGASPVWQLVGVLTSLAVGGRCLQLIWRTAFSTDPRHLSRG